MFLAALAIPSPPLPRLTHVAAGAGGGQGGGRFALQRARPLRHRRRRRPRRAPAPVSRLLDLGARSVRVRLLVRVAYYGEPGAALRLVRGAPRPAPTPSVPPHFPPHFPPLPKELPLCLSATRLCQLDGSFSLSQTWMVAVGRMRITTSTFSRWVWPTASRGWWPSSTTTSPPSSRSTTAPYPTGSGSGAPPFAQPSFFAVRKAANAQTTELPRRAV